MNSPYPLSGFINLEFLEIIKNLHSFIITGNSPVFLDLLSIYTFSMQSKFRIPSRNLLNNKRTFVFIIIKLVKT